MAHSQKLASLATELIQSSAGDSIDLTSRHFKQQRDGAVRAFKSQQYARTNQFDVHNSLNGLVEKFQILHREDLAAALEARLKKLSSISTKWTPEVLALFLELSDRPLEKSNVDDLEKLKPSQPETQLTWDDIFADDPFTEDDIWKDIDYAAHGSSDEDSFELQEDDEPEESSQTSVTSDAAAAAEAFIVEPDHNLRSSLEETQARLQYAMASHSDQNARASTNASVTELLAIREALFLVRSGSSYLFEEDSSTGRLRYKGPARLVQTSQATISVLMARIGDAASAFQQLVAWGGTKQSMPVMQRFQSGVCETIRTFNSGMNDLEQTFIRSGDGEVVVSLSHVSEQITELMSPILESTELVVTLEAQHHNHPYKCLDLLYDRICLAQLTEDRRTFVDLGQIFFSCLQTYLRLVSIWMLSGEVDPDDLTFFVAESNVSNATRAWHNQFSLRTLEDGEIDAPDFIRPFQKRIFNAGRSVIFLKILGTASFDENEDFRAQSRLDFESICQATGENELLPFAERFSQALTEWISSRHTIAASTVRDKLFYDCGLWEALSALEFLYFSRNGSIMQTFSEPIFDKLDARSRSWNDRFLLTELAQDTFSEVSVVDADNVTVRVSTTKARPRSMKALSSIVLEYPLPWSITNIIRKDCTQVYQKIFTFVLQVLRAKQLLRNMLFQRRPTKCSSSTNTNNKSGNLLRFRLARFVDTLYFYLTVSTLEEATASMRLKLVKAEDLDEMAEIHQGYIKKLELRCLLSKNLQPIHAAIVQLLELCVALSDTESQNSSPVTSPRREISAREKKRRRRSALMVSSARADESDSEGEDEKAEAGSDGEKAEYDADVEKLGLHGSYQDKLRKMSKEFDKLNHFIIVGLKGVGRAGGEPCWEMLAERLE